VPMQPWRWFFAALCTVPSTSGVPIRYRHLNLRCQTPSEDLGWLVVLPDSSKLPSHNCIFSVVGWTVSGCCQFSKLEMPAKELLFKELKLQEFLLWFGT
jgi:hypothetical protein